MWAKCLLLAFFVSASALFSTAEVVREKLSDSSTVLYVKPTEDMSCPSEPCHTLAHYVSDPTHSFGSNSRLIFLPGEHTFELDELLDITNVANLSLTGISLNTATIQCTNGGGFRFSHIRGLHISNLGLTNCGPGWKERIATALAIYHVTELTISGVTVQNSTGYGIYGINILGKSSIVDSTFIGNRGNAEYLGGNVGLAVQFSENQCNTLSSESASFTIKSTIITEGGGSEWTTGLNIWIDNPCFDTYLHIDNTTITGNGDLHTLNGGNIGLQIFGYGSAQNHITIEDSLIEGGVAKLNGGNVYIRIHHKGTMHSHNSIAIRNSIIKGGLAEACGGLIIDAVGDSASKSNPEVGREISDILISNTHVVSNNAFTSFGGGSCIILDKTYQEYRVAITNVTFERNSAIFGANLFLSDSGTGRAYEHNTIQIKDSKIQYGKAISGGGMFLQLSNEEVPTALECDGAYETWSNVVHIDNTEFSNNYATYLGGGAAIHTTSQATTGRLHYRQISINDSSFLYNTGEIGSAIAIINVDNVYARSLQYEITFTNVSVQHQKNLTKGTKTVYLQVILNIAFTNCNFNNNSGTAISAIKSNIFFEGNNTFEHNTGYNGGAMALCAESFMLVRPNTHIYFLHNHANHVGGAIHIEQGCSTLESACFYQPDMKDTAPDSVIDAYFSIEIVLENNTAEYAGSAIYGSTVDECHTVIDSKQLDLPKKLLKGRGLFDIWFHYPEGLSVISSNPIGVCFCEENQTKPNCSQEIAIQERYPGEPFTVSVVVVGQRNGTVPGVVIAEFMRESSHSSPSLNNFQKSQSVGMGCTTIDYTVFSNAMSETLILTVDQPESITLQPFSPPKLFVSLLPCPLGFNLTGNPPRCDCATSLLKKGLTCDITTQTIHIPAELWIGHHYSNGNGYNTEGVLIHPHCPFDYCKNEDLNIHLNDSDEQCTSNRAGILCGACQPEFSLALGSSQCLKCSNTYLALITVLIVAGIVLVYLMNVSNFTVSEGTINGLIFYANVVYINQATLFPPGETNMLTVFIAWLNLDIGFETCLYDGMDMYARTWIQFLFPVYIWFIAILMIVSSHYSTKAAKLVGSNAPKVLATLFLLSYAQLLQNIVAALSFTFLTYPDKSEHALWLYDGNIAYLSGKHIPLFVVALLALIALCIPYTLLILFIQCLQYKSGHPLLSWVRKQKPLLDAYTGPYKNRYRFWTGLILLVRAIMFVAFAVNALGDPALNLLLIAIVTNCLLVAQMLFRGIYKSWPLDILEAFFYLNLSVLSTGSLYIQTAGGSQAAIVYTSVTITLVVFTGIVIYHIKSYLFRYIALCYRGLVGRCKNSDSRPLINPAYSNYHDVEQNQEVPYSPPADLRRVEVRTLVLSFNGYREPVLQYEDD